MQRIIVGLLVGLGLGALVGVIFGWLVPLGDVSAGFPELHPVYKVEYAVMVSTAYAANDDWDMLQARLGLLEEPDPAAFVVQVTEQAIADGRNPDDIRNLVRVAARFGYTTPVMIPYLTPGS